MRVSLEVGAVTMALNGDVLELNFAKWPLQKLAAFPRSLAIAKRGEGLARKERIITCVGFGQGVLR